MHFIYQSTFQQGLLHAVKPLSARQSQPQRDVSCPDLSSGQAPPTSKPASFSSPTSLCTMTVELQSKERVSAKGKRKTETALTLNRCVVGYLTCVLVFVPSPFPMFQITVACCRLGVGVGGGCCCLFVNWVKNVVITIPPIINTDKTAIFYSAVNGLS